MSEQRHLPELDGVRAMAVLAVVAHHGFGGTQAVGQLDHLILAAADAGWIGVDLFFLLSGYLITRILLAGRGSRGFLRSFYTRRTLRIFPAHYTLLFLLFVVAPALGVSSVGASAADAAWFWLYLGNVLTALRGWPDPVLVPLWSLGIEEHFYLLWPLLVLTLPTRFLRPAAIATILGSTCLRYLGLAYGWSPLAVYVLTPTRLDALAIGSLLAMTAGPSGTVSPKLGRNGAIAGSVLLALGIRAIQTGRGHWGDWRPSQLVVGLSGLAIGLGGLLAFLLSRNSSHPLRAILRAKVLTLIGRRSYAIYLYHMPLIMIAREVGMDPISRSIPGEPNWPYLLVYSLVQGGLLLLVAELSFRVVEGPFLTLKDRFPYPRT